MKRLGLICNFLPATLFLAVAVCGGSHVRAQEVSAELLKALPPKPVAPAAEKKRGAAMTAEIQPVRARLLGMFDQDKDGRLDGKERAAAKKHAEERGFGADRPSRQRPTKAGAPGEAMRTELRRRFDRNRDGKIDAAEMPALEQATRARLGSVPALRQRYDKNGDGSLDDKEWTAARAQIQRWVNEAPAR